VDYSNFTVKELDVLILDGAMRLQYEHELRQESSLNNEYQYNEVEQQENEE
jgi:hypothetical protein